jgi:hypothetical protein
MLIHEEDETIHQILCQVMLTRVELENVWLARVKDARERYGRAGKEVKSLISAPRFDLNNLDAARQAEHEALEGYVHVLRIFNDLILRGKIPNEWGHGNRATGVQDIDQPRPATIALSTPRSGS